MVSDHRLGCEPACIGPFSYGTQDRVPYLYHGKESEEQLVVPDAHHYQLMIEQLADSVLFGASPSVSLAESIANIQVLSALMDSALQQSLLQS